MKNKLATILLAVSAITAPLMARADLIWYENFNYTNGSLTTNSGGLWARESGTATAPGDMLVLNSNLQVSATGGTVSRQDDCDRLFALTPNSPYTNAVQLVYASFTIICTNLPNGPGSYFASFYSTSKGYCGRMQAFTNGTVLPNTWRLGVTDNSLATNPANGGFQVDLALNTPYHVVEELDPINLGACTIWINPININDTGANTTDPSYTANDTIGFQTTNQVNSYAFRQASSFGNAFFLITNLSIATTFAEAATNVWSTNAVSPTIVYQPVGTTNFVGAAFSLSAVANGQGLGSLTYQWQKNGVNVSGSGNVFSLSSAAATDSGNYTLIATTPYGLSTTSSIATVLISTAPVPPSFITQPVSQTVYAGQTVTLSTTVNSPGNVSYQWKSNSVNIAGANSSTFILNNVTAGFSASYSVGVTNDVVPNGIVSSNAVLTVSVPQQVAISYLHTLVDPLTYTPTNIPATIPYTVTGIVTTYTNITSGTTASYYLQDGTGGINIFVTGDSTFRPALGDVVKFTGVLSSFTGLELDADVTAGTTLPYTSYTDLSNNIAALPAPISIPFNILTNLDNVNYNLSGALVKISDVYFGTNAGKTISTTANQNLIVTNSSGQQFHVLFYDLDLDTAGQTLPAYAYSVSGPLYNISSNAIIVTKFSDIVTNAAAVPVLPLTITPSSVSITSLSGVATASFSFTNTPGLSFSILATNNLTAPIATWPVVGHAVETPANSGKYQFTDTNSATNGAEFYLLRQP